MRVYVHSEVDLITNSSTELFLWFSGSAEATIKKFLADALSAAGVTESVDDLFDISRDGDEELVVIPKKAIGSARLNIARGLLSIVDGDAEYNG